MMSGWKVHYRDRYDQDRISSNLLSREAALRLANGLHSQRAYLYKIVAPNGRALPKEQILAWASDNKWSSFRASPDADYT